MKKIKYTNHNKKKLEAPQSVLDSLKQDDQLCSDVLGTLNDDYLLYLEGLVQTSNQSQNKKQNKQKIDSKNGLDLDQHSKIILQKQHLNQKQVSKSQTFFSDKIAHEEQRVIFNIDDNICKDTIQIIDSPKRLLIEQSQEEEYEDRMNSKQSALLSQQKKYATSKKKEFMQDNLLDGKRQKGQQNQQLNKQGQSHSKEKFIGNLDNYLESLSQHNKSDKKQTKKNSKQTIVPQQPYRGLLSNHDKRYRSQRISYKQPIKYESKLETQSSESLVYNSQQQEALRTIQDHSTNQHFNHQKGKTLSYCNYNKSQLSQKRNIGIQQELQQLRKQNSMTKKQNAILKKQNRNLRVQIVSYGEKVDELQTCILMLQKNFKKKENQLQATIQNLAHSLNQSAKHCNDQQQIILNLMKQQLNRNNKEHPNRRNYSAADEKYSMLTNRQKADSFLRKFQSQKKNGRKKIQQKQRIQFRNLANSSSSSLSSSSSSENYSIKIGNSKKKGYLNPAKDLDYSSRKRSKSDKVIKHPKKCVQGHRSRAEICNSVKMLNEQTDYQSLERLLQIKKVDLKKQTNKKVNHADYIRNSSNKWADSQIFKPASSGNALKKQQKTEPSLHQKRTAKNTKQILFFGKEEYKKNKHKAQLQDK